jgi:hypothetical protein
MTAKEFVKFVRKECLKEGITLKIGRGSYVIHPGDKTACGGYFDSEDLVLAVGGNHPQFLSILVHEYAHVTQWQENIEIWQDADKWGGYLWEWLAGVNNRKYKIGAQYLRDLELDNEKRSVELIKKFSLEINIPDYIQRANAYVLYYNWLPETRKWLGRGKSIYMNEYLIKHMSKRFDMDYEKLSPELQEVFRNADL